MEQPKGLRHIWMIENKDGVFKWKCCNCPAVTEEDIPPSHGCEESKNEPDNRS